MTISPVSDIILDVARAADPAKSRIAAEKLSRGEPVGRTMSGSFDHVFLHSTSGPPTPAGQSRIDRDSSHPLSLANSRSKAYKGLEQLVLRNLVEAMLPSGPATFFGTGMAGDIWRSLLADQLAEGIGKTVDLGISRQAGAPNAMTRRALPLGTNAVTLANRSAAQDS